MTTIQGAHNHVIQQADKAHDAVHNLKPVQPDPGHLQNQQAMREKSEQTTVISAHSSGDVNVKAGAKKREEQDKILKKKRGENRNKRENIPGLPGNLLNTVV